MSVTIEKGFIKMTAGSDTYSGKIEPSFYKWRSPVAGGDVCVLLDGFGRELFNATAEGANAVNLQPHVTEHKSKFVHDLNLSAMTAGVMEVHYKSLG